MVVPERALLPSVQPVTLVRGVKVMALHASVSTEPLVTVTLAGVTRASSTAKVTTAVAAPAKVTVPSRLLACVSVDVMPLTFRSFRSSPVVAWLVPVSPRKSVRHPERLG